MTDKDRILAQRRARGGRRERDDAKGNPGETAIVRVWSAAAFVELISTKALVGFRGDGDLARTNETRGFDT
jgi:hypothetical protein